MCIRDRGDVDLGTLSVEELDLELAMGGVSADSLTVKDADFDLAMGDCHICLLYTSRCV